MKKALATVLLLLTVCLAQEITWITGSTDSDVDYANKMAAQYMQDNAGVTVNVLRGAESATNRARQYLQYFEARSAEVDVLEIDVIWPGDMAEHLLDLNDYTQFERVASDFFPAIVENNTVNGALVAVPYFTDVGMLYYRSDLLEKYNLDVPGTWAELETAAQTIQDGERAAGNPDFWGYVWQGNAYEGLTCDALEWVASFGGGEIVSPEGVITVNNAQAAAAINMAATWVGTISPDTVTSFQEAETMTVWQAKNAAFMRNWPYAYTATLDTEVGENFGVAPLPSAQGKRSAATLGGSQLAVSDYSRQPELAADFIAFLTSGEGQLSRAIEKGNLPTRVALYRSDALESSSSAFMTDFLPVLEASVARPSTATAPHYLAASQLFFTAVHSVLTGEDSAKDALAILEIDLENLTGLSSD